MNHKNTERDFNQELQEKEAENLPFGDFMLEIYIMYAKYDVNIGITLNVKGLIISGMLITEKQYCMKLAEKFSQTEMIPEVKENFNKLLSDWIRIADELEQSKNYIPSYIHLENARSYFAGQPPIPANEGWLWRGRLSEVDGFSIGELSSLID